MDDCPLTLDFFFAKEALALAGKLMVVKRTGCHQLGIKHEPVVCVKAEMCIVYRDGLKGGPQAL